ncbi:MAG: hypothetical protein KAT26_06830, partial [Marinosulfonomonas sp.]|nr:hypothetical protein [Marinosulfonomonas sp.]
WKHCGSKRMRLKGVAERQLIKVGKKYWNLHLRLLTAQSCCLSGLAPPKLGLPKAAIRASYSPSANYVAAKCNLVESADA